MPRPPRNRVGATRTRPTAATVATTRNSSSPPLSVLPKQSENDGQDDAVGNDLPSDIYDISDAEKERRKVRASAKNASPVETTTTTTTTTARRTRDSVNHTLELNSDQTRALDSSRKHRDDAMARLNDMTSTSKAESGVERSRREPVLGESTARHDASGLDVDVTLGSLDDTLGIDDSTEIELGYATRATDTSTFNIAGFKRRPRQSSVQGRGDAPIRPSSRGQATPSISTTISFGKFKRRAREPSILGTARKNRRQRSVSRGSQASRNREMLGRGDESGDEGVEGELTPVDGGKRRSTTRGRSRGVESDGEMDGSPVAGASRKRKSLESHQDGREKRVAVEGEDMDVDVEVENKDDEPDLDFDLDAELEPRVASPAREQAEDVHESIELDEQPPISSPLSSPPREVSTPPQLFDENDPDLAPPRSSSPSEAGSPVAWPSLNTLAQRKYNTRAVPTKTPELEDDDMESNISSPPSLTHSPNYRAKSKPAVVKKKAPPPPKSSADLASLLPRRKTSSKNRKGSNSADPFDLDDGEGSEEEAPPPTRRVAKKPLAKAASTANKGKQKETASADPKGKKKRVTRTYGSKAHEQDKENDEDNAEDREEKSIVVGSGSNEPEEEDEELPEAETTVMLTERLGEELQKAVKKFKEVDQWELSFEEVSGSSSPMRDAR